MKAHGLLLQRHTGNGVEQRHIFRDRKPAGLGAPSSTKKPLKVSENRKISQPIPSAAVLASAIISILGGAHGRRAFFIHTSIERHARIAAPSSGHFSNEGLGRRRLAVVGAIESSADTWELLTAVAT
jgi:hypothetical protein